MPKAVLQDQDSVDPSGRTEIRFLTSNDLEAVQDLQQAVFDHFAAEKRHFIKLRTPQAILACLQTPYGGLGLWTHEGFLAAQVLLTQAKNPILFARHLSCPWNFYIELGQASIALIQGVLVHPTWRHRGFMSRMLLEAEAKARADGVTHLVAKVNQMNTESFNGFKKNGFSVFKGYNDTQDGLPRYLMLKNI